MLLGVISQCDPFIHPPKRPSSPFRVDQEENIPGHSTERKAYWFVLKIARVFPIPTGRVGIGERYVRDSLENKSMLAHFKKVFLLPSVWPGTEYTWALI